MNDRSQPPKLPIQHRLDWDVRGIIAVLSVLGVFSLAGLRLGGGVRYIENSELLVNKVAYLFGLLIGN